MFVKNELYKNVNKDQTLTDEDDLMYEKMAEDQAYQNALYNAEMERQCPNDYS